MSSRGFTLVELLVATLLMLVVLGTGLALVTHARAAFDRDTAGADLAQRLRIGLQALGQDIRGAGAGASVAEHLRISDSLPVLEPLADLDALAPAGDGFHALRVLTIPAEAGQARLREPSRAGADPLRLTGPPRCPSGRPGCGFRPGGRALLFDGTAIHDRFEIDEVDGADFSLRPGTPLGGSYGVGAAVADVEVVTYGLSRDGLGNQRLVKVSTGGASMPLLDHVVEFEVEVYGAAVPPMPSANPDAPPTYGPRPPPAARDDDRDPWGVGENCTIAVGEDGARVPRLPQLGAPGQLVPLTAQMLSDGPWCPGTGGPGDFDADLLRIRRVDVRLRVEVASAMLRGPAGRLYARPGRGSRSLSWVPDGELRLSIVPRNLPHP